jgi:hypothetical protein
MNRWCLNGTEGQASIAAIQRQTIISNGSRGAVYKTALASK